jgi:hypothetical protein
MQQYARESDELIAAAPVTTKPPPGPSSDAAPIIELGDPVTEDEAEVIYWARLGSASRVPFLARPIEELVREERSAAEGFVLNAVDGKASIEHVLRACGLSRPAALCILCELVERGLIALKGP